MANPDISSITELNAGTLAFTLKTDQVTFLMATQEDPVVSGQQTFDISFELNDATDGKLSKHATFKDEFMMGFMMTSSAMGGSPSLAFNGDSGSQAFTDLTNADWNEGAGGNLDGKTWYLKNPTLSDGDLEASFGSSTEYGHCSVMAFSHVDQTNPFKTQPWYNHAGLSNEDDHAIWIGHENGYRKSFVHDPVGYTGLENNRRITRTSSSTARNNFRYDEASEDTSNPNYYYGMMPMEMNPGDLMVGCIQPSNYMTYFDFQNLESIGGSKGGNSDQRSAHLFIGNYEGPDKIPMFGKRTDFPGDGPNRCSLTYTVLQSNQTKTTLFAGVADYLIKLNQIYIANPAVQGTMVDIDITGLTGSGTNFTQSGGGTVITVTGDSASNPTDFSLCKGKFAQSHKPIPILDRPIYLPATAGLKAKATHVLPHIEYLDRTVDVVVDFEVIGDA